MKMLKGNLSPINQFNYNISFLLIKHFLNINMYLFLIPLYNTFINYLPVQMIGIFKIKGELL